MRYDVLKPLHACGSGRQGLSSTLRRAGVSLSLNAVLQAEEVRPFERIGCSRVVSRCSPLQDTSFE